MKTIIKKQITYIISLLIISAAFLSGCEKEQVLIEEVSGRVIDKVTGYSIQGAKVSIMEPPPFCFKHCFSELVYFQLTDENGYYQFNKLIDGYYVVCDGHEGYQKRTKWINGAVDSPTSRVNTTIEFNPSSPVEFNFELYPITRFKIHVSNVPPSSQTDVIYFEIENMKFSYFLSEFHEFSFRGIPKDTIIEGEIWNKNILPITYRVSDASGVNEYSKTVACEPGGMTDIIIEY